MSKKCSLTPTLIALVITIMVLVILAGVTINLTVGENGIFSKAKYAKEKYINEEYAEQEQLNELYAYLAKDSQVPNNTKDIEAGKSELTISNGTTAIDFAAQNTATSWTNASFSIKDGWKYSHRENNNESRRDTILSCRLFYST